MNPATKELLKKLCKISREGPIPAVGHGATTVGMTLLKRLGIEYQSTRKPNFKGIVVCARRDGGNFQENRVNLFAKVPKWTISKCKSSAEIVERYGYDDGGGGQRKLYCTVRAHRPNSQGLYLEVDRAKDMLYELVKIDKERERVAVWLISDLQKRLVAAHPETMWVTTKVVKKEGKEFFHYRYAVLTAAPQPDRLADALDEGTVTVDHLIDQKKGRTIEKGPLFKIKPSNIGALFGVPQKFDLLSFE